MIRIDKFLSQMQVATRSESKKLIKMKRITKNGALVTDGGEKCDPKKDCICLDGHPIAYQEYHYLMLHKPAGCVTATEDRQDKTVMDYLPDNLRRGLSPVGRLDKDTTGLMILTDDGALAHEILAPQKHVPKQYRVTIDIPMTEEMVHRFAEGIELKDGRCQPAELTIESEDTGVVTLREGRYHQIKRMFGCCGAVVTGLHRLSMGALRLDDTLAPGECRPLSEEELSLLRQQHLPE